MNNSPNSRSTYLECRAVWARISCQVRTAFLRDRSIPPAAPDAFAMVLAQFGSHEAFLHDYTVHLMLEITELRLAERDQAGMNQLSRPVGVIIRNGNFAIAV